MARLPYLQRSTLGEAALPLLSTLGEAALPLLCTLGDAALPLLGTVGDAALFLAALPLRLGRAGWPQRAYSCGCNLCFPEQGTVGEPEQSGDRQPSGARRVNKAPSANRRSSELS